MTILSRISEKLSDISTKTPTPPPTPPPTLPPTKPTQDTVQIPCTICGVHILMSKANFYDMDNFPVGIPPTAHPDVVSYYTRKGGIIKLCKFCRDLEACLSCSVLCGGGICRYCKNTIEM